MPESLTTETYTASICTDCHMYSHYGDDSFSDYVTPEMASDIRQGFDELGNVHVADHHEEAHFSWSPCDICGSHLGGDRHDVDIIEMGG